MKIGKNANVKIVGCGTGMASNEKKTPYFTIEFENQEGESIDAILYLTELTKERNLQKLVDLGFQGKRLSDLSDPKKTIADLFQPLAEEINLTIKEEQIVKDGVDQVDEKTGKPKMRKVVEWINVGEGGGISKFDHATAVKSFNALTFDSEIQNLRKKAGTKPAPKAKDEPIIPKGESAAETADGANVTDEDCPF